MPDIVLATLNAKYIHAAFGLRYLYANLPEALQPRTAIREFDINQRPIDIVEKILLDEPKILGLGVYIWNAEQTLKIVQDLKRLRPRLTVVLGGPEVSYETEQQEICGLADYVVRGEADLAFGALVEKLLAGQRPLMRVIDAELPEFASSPPLPPGEGRGEGAGPVKGQPASANALPLSRRERELSLPYHLYSDHDITHRVMYVEASRGCPFKCEFCLSSLDVPVRNAPLQPFLDHMQRLLDRGAKQFKFVDRTFNLNLKIGVAILQFFLARYTPGLFVHFEMIPDRLPEQLRSIIAQFPPGALQFEVGIQTFNEEVEKLISRRQDHGRLDDNLRWLRDHTGVHVHADLIVGLPGEDLDSFGRGFDRLLELRPQEIQVGILKRLRGTPIIRHDTDWEMVYSPHPPFEILQTKLVSFDQMQRMRRFSRYWDLVANSGKFSKTMELLLSPSRATTGDGDTSPAGADCPTRCEIALVGTSCDSSPEIGGGGVGVRADAKRANDGNAAEDPHPTSPVYGGGARSRHLTCSERVMSDPREPVEGEAASDPQRERGSFGRFLAFSDWLYERAGQRTHGIALHDLTEFLRTFLADVERMDPALVDQTIKQDQNPRRKEGGPKRQERHLAGRS